MMVEAPGLFSTITDAPRAGRSYLALHAFADCCVKSALVLEASLRSDPGFHADYLCMQWSDGACGIYRSSREQCARAHRARKEEPGQAQLRVLVARRHRATERRVAQGIRGDRYRARPVQGKRRSGAGAGVRPSADGIRRAVYGEDPGESRKGENRRDRG